jgi:sugar lactone lactonase YvrE
LCEKNKLKIYSSKLASVDSCILGEGPVWDAERQRVLWIDIERGEVHEGTLNDDFVVRNKTHVFNEKVGAVASSQDGSLLVAGERNLIVISPTDQRSLGPRFNLPEVMSRSNDGAVDPVGRFIVGTLATGDEQGQEKLFRIENDGQSTVIDSDLGLSNGIAWSTNGSRMYNVDSLSGIIWTRDYDASTGAVGERSELFRITDGLPDGLCVDAEDNLWIAIWGGGEVRSYSIAGQQLATVKVEAPHTTSVAFVGPNLDLLLITTAEVDLTAEQLIRFPDSGRLFIANVNVVGVPTTPWNQAWELC